MRLFPRVGRQPLCEAARRRHGPEIALRGEHDRVAVECRVSVVATDALGRERNRHQGQEKKTRDFINQNVNWAGRAHHVVLEIRRPSS